MKPNFLQYLIWWGPYVIGVLAMVYAVVLKCTGERNSNEETDSGGVAGQLILPGVALIVAFLLIGFLAVPKDICWRYAVVFLVGGATALVTFAFGAYSARLAPARSSSAFFAVGFAVLEMAFVRNYFREAPMIYLFVAALGIWFTAALLAYGGPIRRGLGVRTLALASSAIAAAVALGIYHYPNSAIGSVFAVDICAVVLLLSILTGLITSFGGKLRLAAAIVAAIALPGLTWWLGTLLSRSVLNDSLGGLCAAIGAAAVLLVAWIAASASRSRRDGRFAYQSCRVRDTVDSCGRCGLGNGHEVACGVWNLACGGRWTCRAAVGLSDSR